MAPGKIDLHRSKRRNSLLILGCLLALAALFLLNEKQEIVVTELAFRTERSTCQVSFTLRNTLDTQTWSNLTIRGVRIEKLGSSLRTIPVGERNLAVVLKGRESRSYDISLPVSAPPDRVLIKFWKSGAP